MKRYLYPLLGLAAFGAVIAHGRAVSSSHRRSFPRFRSSDPRREDHLLGLLLPPFRVRIRQLLQNLRALGYDPFLANTGRSRKRALALARQGLGIADSMHIYGAATDIASLSHGWEDPDFFDALRVEAKRLGLVSGADWGDDSHVQALPVNDQNAFRQMNTDERVKYLTNLYRL